MIDLPNSLLKQLQNYYTVTDFQSLEESLVRTTQTILKKKMSQRQIVLPNNKTFYKVEMVKAI